MAEAERADRAPLLGEQWVGYAQRGLLLIALGALAVGILLLFFAVNEVISVWLEARWVPVWRAVFALAVMAIALYVLTRLTGRRLV